MAKDMDGQMVDPYNGQQDLQDKMIRMVNPEAFKDDPLRMIRAVQFASRFGFQIEPKTMAAIKENASRIREISPERILIEFDKIVKKGSAEIGAKLLAESGLYENIFGGEPQINFAEMQRVKTIGEFIYLLAVGAVKSPAEFYKTNLKGDLDAYNEIRAYEQAYSKPARADDVATKLVIFNMFKTYPKSLESQIIPYETKQNILQMQKSGMPFSLKDLAINGNDLLAMGYTGQQIGEFFRKVIIDIYEGKLQNNREVLLNYITPKEQI
jgi:tRNA nucleotidyltransferase/poly(A) polymerase